MFVQILKIVAELIIISLLYKLAMKIKSLWPRILTIAQSFWTLYNLPKEQVDTFLKSYDLFDNEKVTNNDAKIVDYYSVLNHLCAMGEVEKMYIPPIMDPSRGVFENQILFEKKMMSDIGIPSNAQEKDWKVLDVGCGRGRVAAHVMTQTGASVYGLNIDKNQLENAIQNAESKGLDKKLHFREGNFNDPLPFDDNFFDAMYQIQVFTYAKDFDKLFAELYRVVKPGAKISLLDWVRLDKFDDENKEHQDLMKRVKPLIGAVHTPSPKEFTDHLEKAGFKILLSSDASLEGHQADLIMKADNYFKLANFLVNLLVGIKILPSHLKVLFDRFTKDGEAFVKMDRMGLITTSYQIVAQKPITATN